MLITIFISCSIGNHVHAAGDGKEEGVGSHERRRLQSTDGKGGRKMLETPVFKLEGGLKVYYTYKTCTPVELKVDRVSVLQFEVSMWMHGTTSYCTLLSGIQVCFSEINRRFSHLLLMAEHILTCSLVVPFTRK